MSTLMRTLSKPDPLTTKLLKNTLSSKETKPFLLTPYSLASGITGNLQEFHNNCKANYFFVQESITFCLCSNFCNKSTTKYLKVCFLKNLFRFSLNPNSRKSSKNWSKKSSKKVALCSPTQKVSFCTNQRLKRKKKNPKALLSSNSLNSSTLPNKTRSLWKNLEIDSFCFCNKSSKSPIFSLLAKIPSKPCI